MKRLFKTHREAKMSNGEYLEIMGTEKFFISESMSDIIDTFGNNSVIDFEVYMTEVKKRNPDLKDYTILKSGKSSRICIKEMECAVL